MPSVPAAAPSTPTGLEPLKLALTDVRFLAVIVLFGGSQMSLTIMTAAAPFIAVDLLEGSSGDVALLLGPLLATALPLMIFTPALSRRFGWRRAVVSATALLAVVYGGTGVLGGTLVVSPLVTAALLFAYPSHLAGLAYFALNAFMWLQRFILCMHFSEHRPIVRQPTRAELVSRLRLHRPPPPDLPQRPC